MHGRYSLKLAILTTAISIACGGGSGIRNSKTGGLAAGQLAVSPSTINFGGVPVGTTKHQAATLTAGNSSITVTSADWSGHGYSLSDIVFPLTVPAGQSIEFEIIFSPQTAGKAPGNIKFISNAENSPQATFNGSGTQAVRHRVTLTWRSNASSVVGYNIYRGSAAQGPYTKVNSAPQPGATFTDGSVRGGQTYYYVTTALNKHGKESKFSNRVQVTVPNS
jgi:hypothetical protein